MKITKSFACLLELSPIEAAARMLIAIYDDIVVLFDSHDPILPPNFGPDPIDKIVSSLRWFVYYVVTRFEWALANNISYGKGLSAE